jgi:hypothetical protein
MSTQMLLACGAGSQGAEWLRRREQTRESGRPPPTTGPLGRVVVGDERPRRARGRHGEGAARELDLLEALRRHPTPAICPPVRPSMPPIGSSTTRSAAPKGPQGNRSRHGGRRAAGGRQIRPPVAGHATVRRTSRTGPTSWPTEALATPRGWLEGGLIAERVTPSRQHPVQGGGGFNVGSGKEGGEDPHRHRNVGVAEPPSEGPADTSIKAVSPAEGAAVHNIRVIGRRWDERQSHRRPFCLPLVP